MLASPAIMGPSTSPGGSAQELHSVERSDCRKELGSGRSGLLPQTYHSTIHHLSQKAMAMSGQQTLYERIGGAAAVDQLVDRFYGRVLADPELLPFFANTSVDQLKRMQKEFFAVALNGPVSTSDVDLARIHQGLGITRKHLTRFVNHLIAELDERSHIKPRDAMSITYQIGTYSDQIVDDAGGTGG